MDKKSIILDIAATLTPRDFKDIGLLIQSNDCGHLISFAADGARIDLDKLEEESPKTFEQLFIQVNHKRKS